MRSNEVMIHGFVLHPVCLSVCLSHQLFIYSAAVLDLHGGKHSETLTVKIEVRQLHMRMIIISTVFCSHEPYCLFPRFSVTLYPPFVSADTWWTCFVFSLSSPDVVWISFSQQLSVKVTSLRHVRYQSADFSINKMSFRLCKFVCKKLEVYMKRWKTRFAVSCSGWMSPRSRSQLARLMKQTPTTPSLWTSASEGVGPGRCIFACYPLKTAFICITFAPGFWRKLDHHLRHYVDLSICFMKDSSRIRRTTLIPE